MPPRDLLTGLAADEPEAATHPAVPRAAGEIVEHLKLARSSLVGLPQRMEGLERRRGSCGWAPWDLEHLPSGWKIEVRRRAAGQVR